MSGQEPGPVFAVLYGTGSSWLGYHDTWACFLLQWVIFNAGWTTKKYHWTHFWMWEQYREKQQYCEQGNRVHLHICAAFQMNARSVSRTGKHDCLATYKVSTQKWSRFPDLLSVYHSIFRQLCPLCMSVGSELGLNKLHRQLTKAEPWLASVRYISLC